MILYVNSLYHVSLLNIIYYFYYKFVNATSTKTWFQHTYINHYLENYKLFAKICKIILQLYYNSKYSLLYK